MSFTRVRFGLGVVVAVVALVAGAAPASAVENDFTGATNSDWNTASNWSLATDSTQHHVPTSGEDVKITVFSGAVLDTGADASVNSLTTSSGPVTVQGGRTLTVGSGSSSLTNTVKVLNSSKVHFGGPTTWNSGASSLQLDGTSTIEIAGTFTAAGDTSITPFNTFHGLVHVMSGGTLQKTGGTGTTFVGVELDNDGAVSTNTGTLELHDGDAGSTTGTYSIGSGTTLQYSGGTASLPSLTGVTTPTPSVLSITGGTLTIPSTATAFSVPVVQHGGGSWVVDKNISVASYTTSCCAQVRGGTGTLTVTGTSTLSGLELDGPGVTTVASSATSSAVAGDKLISGATLNLNRSTTMTGGGVQIDPTSQLTVGTGATLSIGDDSSITLFNAAGGVVHLLGSLVKTGGTGTSFVDPILDNDGTVSVQSGTLRMDGGDAGSTTGGFSASSGATLEFENGFVSFTLPSVTGQGKLDVGSSTVTIPSGATFTIPTLTQEGGDLVVNAPVSVPTYTATIGANGTLQGSGGLTITSASSMTNLDVRGPGATTVTAAATSSTLDGGDVQSGGNLVLNHNTSLGASGFSVGSNGRLTVNATLTPSGSINMNGGTVAGHGTIAGDLDNNNGTVAAGTSPGHLTITGSYSQGSGGTLAEEITGKALSAFDRLTVDGDLSLDGTLAIDSSSYAPFNTDTFKIINAAASRSGTFSNITGNTLAGGATYTTQYDPDGVTLKVTGGRTPTPPADGHPTIPSTGKVGQHITCNHGQWTGFPDSFAYSWTIDGSLIANQHGHVYTLAAGDAGHKIHCIVVAHNQFGNSAPATSNTLKVAVPTSSCKDVIPPTSRIKKKKVSLAGGRFVLRGTASDLCRPGKPGRVVRVVVTVAHHLDPSKGKNRCRFLLEDGHRLGPVRPCDGHPPIVFPARGTKKWVLNMPAHLPKLTYTVRSLATDAAGHVQKVDRSGPNVLSLHVK